MADRFRIQNNLETLRDFSAPGEEGTTRLSYTPAYLQAVDYLKKEMEAAGLRTWEDGVGNVYGELKGTDETAPVILSGPISIPSAVPVISTVRPASSVLWKPQEC